MRQISLEFTLRAPQAEIDRNLKRFNVLVCHRRMGKTVYCIARLFKAAAECKKHNPRFAYVAPLYKQAKTVSWDYLKHFASRANCTINEAELRVDLPNGARIQLLGADNYDTLRGIYLDGVVMDEYAQMPPKAWREVIRPALSDREGWAIFIGTPKGKNEFWKLYEDNKTKPDWYVGMFKASETGMLPESELESARETMTEDEYEQEYECSFSAALQGAYYGRLLNQAESQGRIGFVPHRPEIKVHTAWDLGVGDSTSIWFFQQVGPEIGLIDFEEDAGKGLDFYARILKDKDYTYGSHYAPHDIKVREWVSGKSRIDQAKNLGIKFTVVPNVALEDGINAVRAILPRCRFDEKSTAYGLECLRQYRREFDEKVNDFRDRPLHDWTSHAADAFRYLALGIRDQYVKPEPTWPTEMTFNEHFQNHIGGREGRI